VIKDSTGAVPTWVTAITDGAAANKFIIQVAIDDETYITNVHAMTVEVGFANYPTSADALHPTKTFSFNVDVKAAVCDCSLVTWNDPENIPILMSAMVVTEPASQLLLEAGPEESSLTATSGARACDHINDECDYKYTIKAQMEDGSDLPDWLDYQRPTLYATPVLSEHIGVWLVQMNQTRISNGVRTVYDAAKITVTCRILTWTPPNMPTIDQATYSIFDPDFKITLTPEFGQ